MHRHLSALVWRAKLTLLSHFRLCRPGNQTSGKLSVAALIFATILALASHAAAQRRSGTAPAAAVPSPRSVLGFNPGDDRTIADWKQITDYLTRLATASNRVKIETIGQSTLGRPLIAAFISAPENIRNLEKYKAIQARLADPRKVKDDAERDQLVRDGKTVVVISCSIHSTEIVASQMSMQLAYQLASQQDLDTIDILRNTIVILVPSPNPDGVDIVANWYRKTLGTPTEGRDPPELYHHYAGHDDNRDWFMLDLKETKAVTRLFWKEWFPEIVYDIHQQGSNGSRFFVPPFYDPSNPHIAPLLLRQVGLIGHKMAADVTAAGFHGVLTNALYDTWWHGGFRTAPYFHNSVGILTEASSARIMTPSTVTREQLARSSTRGMRSALEATTNFPDLWPGGEWHPRDIMQMELIACHSVLSLASNYRADYLHNFFELGRANLSSKGEGEPVAYLIPAGQGRDENVAKMIGALVEQGVEVFRLEHELHGVAGEQVIGARQRGDTGPKFTVMARPMQEIPAGSYVVFLSQPYREDVLALFEPQVYPNRLTANGDAERPYDVAGWTLPMMMGVESLAVVSIQEPASERRLTPITSENDVRRDFGMRLWARDKSPIANPVPAGFRIGIYQSPRGNMDEGWTRFVFDTFNVPYESLHDEAIAGGNLRARFDAIVLPSDRGRESADGPPPANAPAEAPSAGGEKGTDSLRHFVAEGGTLVCFDGSCGPIIRQWKLPLRNVLEGLRSSDFYCPGSILRINVDTSNPIARTMSKDVDAYFIGSSAFEVTDKDRVQVIARYAKENVLRSGWLLGEDRIKDRVALAEVPLGKGRVILFAFRPQHRGQTWGTFPFIWNALQSRTDMSKKSEMEPKLVNAPEIKMIGIQARTTNQQETDPATAKIPGLWGRFYQQQIAEQIPNRKTPGPVLAAYTQYESDFTGPYSLIVGGEVTNLTSVPADMTGITIPAGKYLDFGAQGPMPKALIDTWKYIWDYFQNHPTYQRAYTTDYEVHSAEDRAEILIAIK
jgi:predicted transcriptional regulator YdeE